MTTEKITRRAAIQLATVMLATGCDRNDQSQVTVSGGQLLNELEQLLVAKVPQRVQALRIREPMYCLRLWYFGSDTPQEFLDFRLTLKSAAVRDRLVSEKGEGSPHYIWCADEVESGQGVVNSDLGDLQITRYYRQWMKNASSGPRPPNDRPLVSLREMSQRVATALNKIDWSEFCPVTDDFVVFPADGSHTFMADFDELTSSVQPERIELLRTRRLLGSQEWYRL